MLENFLSSKEYQGFIENLKRNIKTSRHRAAVSVNTELISLYYNIGQQIVLKQKTTGWGDKLVGQVEKDLKIAFPEMSGFSRRNLNYMKQLYQYFNEQEFVPQLVAQIPWGHIRLILDKINNLNEAEFYIKKTIENLWSRAILDHQISINLYQRQGGLLSNFNSAISDGDPVLIQEAFKENYVLDFLNITTVAKERDLQKSLIKNITKLILELGKGFAFVGEEYKLTVGNQEFFIDLLFYNYILKRFVVIELKTTDFKPDYAGQIAFYVAAVDRNIKSTSDGLTIGLIICKNKNNTVVEYTLSGSQKPIGIAEFKFSDVPADIAKYLPNESEIKSFLS